MFANSCHSWNFTSFSYYLLSIQIVSVEEDTDLVTSYSVMSLNSIFLTFIVQISSITISHYITFLVYCSSLFLMLRSNSVPSSAQKSVVQTHAWIVFTYLVVFCFMFLIVPVNRLSFSLLLKLELPSNSASAKTITPVSGTSFRDFFEGIPINIIWFSPSAFLVITSMKILWTQKSRIVLWKSVLP